MTSLLSLPLDTLAVSILGMLMCGFIMFACVCRINVSEARRLRVSLVQVMLLSFAYWAASTFRELWHGQEFTACDFSAGLGIMLYVLVTTRHWLRRERRAHGKPRPTWMEEGDEHAAARF